LTRTPRFPRGVLAVSGRRSCRSSWWRLERTSIKP